MTGRSLLLATVAGCLASALLAASVGPATADTTGAAVPAGPSGPSPANAAKTATPIKHLVVIFNENVSFDHYFATYPSASQSAGRAALRRLPRNAAGEQSGVGESADRITRIHQHGERRRCRRCRSGWTARRPTPPTRTTPTPPEQQAYNGGKADLFPKYTGKGTPGGAGAFGTKGQVMGYFDGNTVTALVALRAAFRDERQRLHRHLRSVDAGHARIGLRPDQRHADRRDQQAAVNAARPVSYYVGDGQGGLTMINDVDPGYDVCSVPTGPGDDGGQEHRRSAERGGITWGGFMGGFNLETDERQRHDRLQAQHAFAGGRQGRRSTTSRITTGSSISPRRPTRRMRARARSRPSATACRPTARRRIRRTTSTTCTTSTHAVKAGNFPAVSFIKAAGVPGRPCRLFRSARRAGRHGDAGQLPAAAAGLEEHRDHRHLGRLGRLVRPRLHASRPCLVRCRRPISSTARESAARARAPLGVDGQAGERPLRSGHAHSVPGHLAVGARRTTSIIRRSRRPRWCASSRTTGCTASASAAVVRCDCGIGRRHVRLQIDTPGCGAVSRSGHRQRVEGGAALTFEAHALPPYNRSCDSPFRVTPPW